MNFMTHRYSIYWLLFVLLLFIAGCGFFQNVDVPERVFVDQEELPSIEASDFNQASIRFMPQKADIARRFESEAGIDREVWSMPIQQVMARDGIQHDSANIQFGTSDQRSDPDRDTRSYRQRVPHDDEFIISEHLNRITSQSHRVEWEGHTFYLFSKSIDTRPNDFSGVQFEQDEYEDPTRYHKVYAIDENGRGVAHFKTNKVQPVFVTDGVPKSLPAQPLQFDVIKTKEGPWIIYRDKDGIYARPFVFNGGNRTGQNAELSRGAGTFSFWGEKRIAKADKPYGKFQFLSRVDDSGFIHILWTDSRDRKDLWYCRYHKVENVVCETPKRLSRTASRHPVNLILYDNNVYITWIDERFRQGFWNPKNFAKLFVVKSEDRGDSFGQPISIHPPRDADEHAAYSVTMPAHEGGLYIFWGTQSLGSRDYSQDLFVGLLDESLETLYMDREKVSGSYLREVMMDNILMYHHDIER